MLNDTNGKYAMKRKEAVSGYFLVVFHIHRETEATCKGDGHLKMSVFWAAVLRATRQPS